MIAVCMAVAAGSIGDYWINSGTHPVYNPKIKPIAMGGNRPELPWPVFAEPTPEEAKAKLEREKDEVVEACVNARLIIDKMAEQLATERDKPMPDASLINTLMQLREIFQNDLKRHAEMIRKYPELQERIEVDHHNQKAKGK